MIDAYIAPEMQKLMPAIADAQGDMTKVAGDSLYPVLNMLNTKYVIMPLQGGQTRSHHESVCLRQRLVCGQGDYVDNANQEMEAVGKLNLRHEAVADKQFQAATGRESVEDRYGASDADGV